MGVTRIWSDASYSHTTREGGWGALIQHDGKFHQFYGKFKKNHSSFGGMERIAIVNALHIANRLGAHSVQLYTDNKSEADMLTRMKLGKKTNKLGFNVYKKLSKKFRVVEIQHLNRKYNYIADRLANRGRKEV